MLGVLGFYTLTARGGVYQGLVRKSVLGQVAWHLRVLEIMLTIMGQPPRHQHRHSNHHP